MPQMSQVLRDSAIGMLTAGMSTSCCLFISTISRLQRRFREFGSTSNRPHNRRPRVTTPAQDLHIQHLHLQDRLRPATRTAAATIALHNQIISAQTWLVLYSYFTLLWTATPIACEPHRDRWSTCLFPSEWTVLDWRMPRWTVWRCKTRALWFPSCRKRGGNHGIQS